MTRHTQLFSQNQDKDYDMYSINVKPGHHSNHSSLGGIEVTTEMSVMQESVKKDTSSQRGLVMDV
jgi:hypothetical protein